jgi:hypothetical protein
VGGCQRLVFWRKVLKASNKNLFYRQDAKAAKKNKKENTENPLKTPLHFAFLGGLGALAVQIALFLIFARGFLISSRKKRGINATA